MAMQSLVTGCHYGFFCQIFDLVIFWAKCRDFVMSKTKEMDFVVKGYRELQIREKIHNSSYKGRIMHVCLFAGPLSEILCGFILFSLFQKVDFVHLCVFFVLYLDVTLFTVIISSALLHLSISWQRIG